jgi:hypothetical protein
MTKREFRKLALELPDAVEAAHMNHPDFRVSGKIFATLAPKGQDWGMVKLTPDQQQTFVSTEPKIFQPVKGGWGRQGCTNVILKEANEESVRQALLTAWKNIARC